MILLHVFPHMKCITTNTLWFLKILVCKIFKMKFMTMLTDSPKINFVLWIYNHRRKKITDAKLKKKINTFCKGEFENWHWMYISKYRWALKSGPWTAVKWQHFFLYLHPSFSKWRKLHWGDTNSLSQSKTSSLKLKIYDI